MGSRRGRAIGGAVVAVLLVGLAAAAGVSCSGADDDETEATFVHETDDEVPGLRFLPEDPTASGSPAPLTGLPVADAEALDRPLLAVKVDNLDDAGETARPQAGLAAADVVVEEVVEGGITRFVALFHSTDPGIAGPVRSARTTDVHLLPAFGTALFAYSGGNPGVLEAVQGSPYIVDRGGEAPPAYERVPGRSAPHDLAVSAADIWADPGEATPPRPLADFLGAGEEVDGGRSVLGVAIDHGGPSSSPVRWEWSPVAHRWVRHQNDTVHVDTDGYAVGPRNLLVLVTEVTTSPADPASPEVVTVGDGEAWILVDGRMIEGRWERPEEDGPFTFLDDAGEPVALTPGRTWIELVPPGVAQVIDHPDTTTTEA